MKLTFKKLRTCEGHEGQAYSADMYLDGKRVASLTQAGNGGETMFHWSDPTAEEKLLAEARRRDPDGSYPHMEVDCMVAEAIDLQEEAKYLKRLCRTKTVLRDPKDRPGEYVTYRRVYDPQQRMAFLAKNPGCEIVNERFL